MANIKDILEKDVHDEEFMKTSYSEFLFINLYMINNKIEYDLVFENVKKDYDLFLVSEYNNDNKSEIDCINDFLTNNNK